MKRSICGNLQEWSAIEKWLLMFIYLPSHLLLNPLQAITQRFQKLHEFHISNIHLLKNDREQTIKSSHVEKEFHYLSNES